MKNTLLVLRTFIEYPELGNIDIVCNKLCLLQGKINDGEEQILTKFEYEEWTKLLNLLNTNPNLKSRIKMYTRLEEIKKDNGKNYDSINEIFMTYGIHVCPSEIEGWGHYLYEAMSSENIVIVTDRSPINEYIINKENGFIIKSYEGDKKVYGSYGHFDIPKMKFNTYDLFYVLNNIKSMDDLTLQKIGKNARKTYLLNDNKFKHDFANFIESILPSS